ncbi:hypothetical protein TrST_g7675 [Triparma strigata]|uniref:protein-serine/threonine phosphatase n=1 Tax=Triparma strigata TaxID=1606541 RepID=A0A9W6ZUR8_9STRA|nr:hypothetical protein TrST_g7675 [Triparma strigata]
MASFLSNFGSAISDNLPSFVASIVGAGAVTEDSVVGYSLDQNEDHRPTQEDEVTAILRYPASLPVPPASTSTEAMAAPLWRRSSYQSYLAVYDGHGGSTASGICCAEMPGILSGLLPPPTTTATIATGESSLKSTVPSSYELMSTGSTTSTTSVTTASTVDEGAVESGTSVSSSIIEAYQKTDELLNQVDPDCGTTVAQCLIRVEGDGRDAVLYASNVGDSRCVLVKSKNKGKNSGKGGENFVRLTVDHRCSNEEEVERIKKADGFVFRNRVSGTLAVTRALGHRNNKDLILSLPEVKRVVLEVEDLAVVVATDGIWDKIKEEEVAEKVENMRAEGKSPKEVAQDLKNQAMQRYGRDNIGVVILYL